MVGHRHLKPACLPIPALPQTVFTFQREIYYSMATVFVKEKITVIPVYKSIKNHPRVKRVVVHKGYNPMLLADAYNV